MADRSLGRPLAVVQRTSWSESLAQYAFAAFLLLVFVGFEPFATRDSVAAQLLASGEGNITRQVSFIIAFVVIVGMAFMFRGQGVLLAFPMPLSVVLVWCLLSISWAIEPGIATRRLMLTIIVISCVMCSVDMLGTQRSLRVLRFILASILIVNLVSVFTVQQAVHLPGEFEAELAGNWRGLHYHKNIAGPIAALTALIFFHQGIATRRSRDWMLFLGAVVFMFGTQSKTAIGFFGVSLMISAVYRLLGQTEVGRQVFTYLFVTMLVIPALAWIVAYEAIADLMADPGTFTGRVAIWQTTFHYLQDNWLLGSGFGSFWLIGDASPTASVTTDTTRWIQLVAHSHNGYLEMLVTTGIGGLFLALIAFVVIPTKQLLSRGGGDVGLKALILSVVSFIVLANLLETVFLSTNHPEWVIFLVVLAILHRRTLGGGGTSPQVAARSRPW